MNIARVLLAICLVMGAVQCNGNEHQVDAEMGLTHEQLVERK